MFVIILLILILIPVIEIWFFVEVWQSIGGLPTLVAFVTFSLLGAWLITRAGVGVWSRFNEKIAKGEAPHNELLDAVVLLVAGAFLLFPGFLTGLVGLVLLLPPVRAAIRGFATRRVTKRVDRVAGVGSAVGYYTWGRHGAGVTGGFPARSDADVFEVEGFEVEGFEVPSDPPPELNR